MDLQQAFEQHGVTPKYLPTAPELLSVSYAGKSISPGEAIPRSSTLEKPSVSYHGAKQDTDYALLMIDPDLFKTDDPTGEVRHWLEIVRFSSGSGSTTPGIATPVRTITEYLPCTPGVGSGKHRYIFVLAENAVGVAEGTSPGVAGVQPETKNAPQEDLKDRMGFQIQNWLARYGLRPVAANFMLVSADATSALQNVAAGAEALAHKAMGK